jgi:RimJ/RimL family protein N-acetyltransferase
MQPENLLPTLSGDGFLLRPWKEEEAAWYIAARDEEIFRWTTEKRTLTLAETEDAIRAANENPGCVCLAIADADSLDLLGNIALVFLPGSKKSGEIMYWLAPAARGRGIATRAVGLLCHWAFGAFDMDRIVLTTHPENERSQAVARRAGFWRVEGTDPAGSAGNVLRYELRKP